MLMQGNRLPRDFYLDSDVVSIAQSLLGKVLFSNIDGQYTSGIIVETEAYKAPEDKASHAYNNRRTARTETMFGLPGRSYIYLCYGIHHLFNVVTGPAETAHAVLIRAVEPLEGVDVMLKRRKMSTVGQRLTAGPGSLSVALGLHRLLDGTDLTKKGSPIGISEGQRNLNEKGIVASPRVGVAYAEECALWPWRFRVKGNQWTSPAK